MTDKLMPECVACDDKPSAGNNPCAVCGATRHPTPAADEVETVWNALKAQCCSDPVEATKCVMVGKDQLARAMQSRSAEHAVKTNTGRLVEALQDIVNPLAAAQRDAEAQGARLSGQAYAICNSLNYVQDIARRALSAEPVQDRREFDTAAFDEWLKLSEWVQDEFNAGGFKGGAGKHRAIIMREEIERLRGENDALRKGRPAEPAGEEPVVVRKIETVTGDFMTEPGIPFYRIELNGYCADFDSEQAAKNFAAHIKLPATPTNPERLVDAVSFDMDAAPKGEKILLWIPEEDRTHLVKAGYWIRGQWDDNRYAKKPKPYWSTDDERIVGTIDRRKNQPTAWMPLPAAPLKEGEGE